MTQEELESKSGLTQSYISMLERGSVLRPSRDVVTALATALAQDATELLIAADYAVAGALPRLSDDDIARVADAVVRGVKRLLVEAA